MVMNKEQVLELVDLIMHMHASSYRNEAREIVEEKFNSAAQSGPTNKTHAEICSEYKLGERCAWEKGVSCPCTGPCPNLRKPLA